MDTSIAPTHKRIEWLRRYAILEVAGTASALAAAFFVHHISNNLAAAAIAGSLGEGIGYYCAAAIREFSRQARHLADSRRSPLVVRRSLLGMLVEFGPAELLDTLFVRPGLMYAMPLLLGSFGWGLLLGKLLADVFFYSIAIAAYEFRKRVLRNTGNEVQPKSTPSLPVE